MRFSRASFKATSNNPTNPNQNMCAYKVAHCLYVHDEVRYLHTWADLMRAVRKLWSMRSVASVVGANKSNKSVGAIRSDLLKHSAKHDDVSSYVVHVEGHVLLIDRDGKTLVDTDPRKRDRRKVLDVYGVYVKPSALQRLAAKIRG